MTEKELAALVVRNELGEVEAAIRILWLAQLTRDDGVSPQIIFDFFKDHALSAPNRSRLKDKLCADRRVLFDSRAGLFRLRASALLQLNEELGSSVGQPASTPFIAKLEGHLKDVQNGQTRAFLAEAIDCVRNRAHRAAIIMSWCGAISVMQEYVFEHHLDEFNFDAVRNGLLKNPARTIGDMRDISKESQFLESLDRISVLDASLKRALKRCLDRRNEVGHPSEIRVADAAVADHLETLILNVFERFQTTATRRAA